MIDLHCHILPGIDDGAPTLADAVEMCRLAADDGCIAMVATPHQRRGGWWNCERAPLEELRQTLQREVDAAIGSGFEVLPGGEIHVDSQLLGEIARMGTDPIPIDPIPPTRAGVEPVGDSRPAAEPKTGPLPLAGSRYLLLEFDGEDTLAEAEDLVHELVVTGWRPILAHPEFIPWMAADLEAVARLVGLGALSQVTAMSVTGDFGRRAQGFTHRLLDAGLVHFVASDSHSPRRRPPGLRRASEAIAGRWGEETARRLVADNPRAVVADLPLPAAALARVRA